MAKTIMITGASSGIGMACAAAFLDAGWNVGLMGRRKTLLEAVAGTSERAMVLVCDVTKADQVDRAFGALTEKFARLDVLFNNAGVFTPTAPIDQIELADWQQNIDVNLTGSFLCAQAAFRAMRQQSPQGGRIINNGSISAHTPRPGSSPYTATKHAITGLTKSIALDGRSLNITCGQIDIGNADTELLRSLNARAKAANPDVQIDPMMDVAHVAKSVMHMADLPLDANVLNMTVMAPGMAYVGRG